MSRKFLIMAAALIVGLVLGVVVGSAAMAQPAGPMRVFVPTQSTQGMHVVDTMLRTEHLRRQAMLETGATHSEETKTTVPKKGCVEIKNSEELIFSCSNSR